MVSDIFPEQKVWRTIAETNTDGYFVWEILQVVGDVDFCKDSDIYTPTLDSQYIFIQCYHFWTKERAEIFLEKIEFEQVLIIVP